MRDGFAGLGVDVGALSTRLRFAPQDGCIWLEGERMVLLHQAALASLRRELVDTLGLDVARGIFMRFGHTSGATDAALARRAKPDAELAETFLAGPRLHAIEGIAASDPVDYTVDPATGFHAGEWIWRNSVEAEAHLQSFGQAAEPACWMAVGYASAYTSAFMGRPILYREVECRATGAPRCRIVGKPAELWDAEVRDDLHQGLDLTDPGADIESIWADVASPDPVTGMSGERLVGASPGFLSMIALIEKVAKTTAPVLFIGEPGAGKRSGARALHQFGNRSGKPLVTFNCAALTGDQLDAELFGSAVATGSPSRGGRIEHASTGTLFLEDVHRLDLRAQTKLMRLLQTGEIERLGGTQPRPVNVRLVASANDGLIEMARAGLFREDLYYRLAMFPISVPPLRERRPDVPLLIRHFLTRFAERHGKRITGISETGIGYLLTHDFPGNVAELESMIERAVIMAPDGGVLDVTAIAAATDAKPHFLRVSRRGLLMEPGSGILAKRRVAVDVTPQRHGITRGATTYFFDPSGNRNEMFAGLGYLTQKDMPTITWNEENLWRGIFYHTGDAVGDFLGIYT